MVMLGANHCYKSEALNKNYVNEVRVINNMSYKWDFYNYKI